MKDKERKTREPLVHITKRATIPLWKAILVRVVAILIAVVISAVIVVVFTHKNPAEVMKAMINGNFGSARKVLFLLQRTAMLLCISLAVTPAFRMKFWNIGAEGQVLMGALAAAACMFYFGKTRMPNWLLLILMFAASLFFGILWAIIPAIFKAAWNTNETLFTLMMNYVAMQLIQVCVSIWAPNGSGVMGHINPDTYKGWLPDVFGQKYLINIVFVTLLTGILFVYLTFSKHGYEISVVGESENTARYIGINVKKVILRTMALSGMICGFAGFLLVAGENHTITKDLAGGMGFTAIMVAWLAKFNPLIMMGVSFLLSFLHLGGVQVAQDCRLNESIPEIITGIILFFIIGCEFFTRYKLNFRSSGKEAAK
ncbi:MAG: ABC transporter permease [Clostridia bacterium]|jgi:simple sugar transport system permease protein|nr:ABC transporter permease [Clostridia bacterium]MBO7503889.1 ABC transporter permease [Clostridia bacterium]MBP5665804.1 ABC transporter permease [Clostridia bacterium]MBP5766084.1 ABC transporter permease [Clostridia bacterium]MBR5006744.1 ABC transporter permease [Clostridia bacterium]